MAIGRSVERLEDIALVTGAGRFVADMSLPFQLHMRLVRSPVAHGRIVGIEATEALAIAGVVAVWTSKDVADVPPVDFRDPSAEALLPYRQPILASERVRYVGEPVAAVFAVDAYTAEDASEAVHLEIDPLPAPMSRSETPVEFDKAYTTEAMVLRHSYGNVDRRLPRRIPSSTSTWNSSPFRRTDGTRGAIGTHDRGPDMLRLYGAAKVTHRNRDTLSKMLGRSRIGYICMNFMSAGASEFAANSIRKTFWYAWPRCGCAGRSNGSRTDAST